MNKKKLGIIIGVLPIIILVILIVVCINKSGKLSDFELIKFEEVSNKVMSYMDYVDTNETSEFDRYIVYALNYSYNEYDKSSLTIKELKNLIKSIFNVKVDDKKIEETGLTTYMLNNSVIMDRNTDSYSLDISHISKSSIAERKVVTYKLKKVSKDKDLFKAIYEKYEIETPYDVLNYYVESNNPEYNEKGELIKSGKNIDITKLSLYLNAEGKYREFAEFINDDVIKSKGKYVGELKLSYILNKNKLLVDEIK